MNPLESPPPAAAAAPPEERAPGFERLGRGLLVTAVLGVLACVGLVLVADARKVAGRLGEFDLRLLAPVLALSLVNYLLRFGRWQAYLRALGIVLPWGRSLGVFLVGFLLSVTPGKAGELGKAWLVRELGGGAALKALPAVLAERFTDVLSLGVLLGLGVLPFRGGPWVALACLAGVVVAVMVFTWRAGAALLFRWLARLPWVGRHVPHLVEVYDRLTGLLTPGLFLMGLAVAVLAWGAESAGFFLVVREYDPLASFLAAVFNYNAGTFLGGLSMLPGGLVASEGVLTALLDAQGLDTAAAASATLITRAATLWFAVLLGLLALPFVLRWRARENQR